MSDVLSQPLTLPCGAVIPNRLAKAAMTEGLATPQGVAPALVIWPGVDFDEMPERSPSASAPAVSRWILESYERIGKRERFTLLALRKR